MKKLNWKNKILWSGVGATVLITPLVAISTVACSSYSKPINKPIQIPSLNVLTQPVNEIAYSNQPKNLPTFAFDIEPIENATIEYQWFSWIDKKWEMISGATNSTYTVTPSEISTVGVKNYHCRVGGRFNGTALKTGYSDTVSLTVLSKQPINIKTQPVDQTVTAGSEISPTFSVIVDPIQGAELSYQWYQLDAKNKRWVKIPGATSSSYNVPKTDFSAKGLKQYFVGINGTINGSQLGADYSKSVLLTVI